MYGTKIPRSLKIEFVRHPSARRIVISYFRYDHPRMAVGRLLAMETEFRVFLGKRRVKSAPVLDMIACIEEIGVWGYCNHRSTRLKEIHYWVAPYANRTSVMEFVLHEVAHAGGFRGEKNALKVAGLGAFAYGVFESRFEGLLKDGKESRGPQDGEEDGNVVVDQLHHEY